MAELLPNGSIVLLEGGNKRLMIYGRKQLLLEEENPGEETAEGTMYDYIGVFYPEGYISPEYTYVFNHSDIIEVIFKGFEDEEEVELKQALKQV
ncbi:DUF4176 domain-containing protein [Virgibacillus halodenitrificans]|uniref:DUF4176 domain-containing protein n=1 Tax=Virgibacillus halodenitrificans TaxID=1482 RepID=UPI002DBCC694|nr:DUF4176 domain-containing protein [Virgibacillus halodenitrificans]MEC2159604.1 DUF4176 domain-containing protein [Virgibacillus halodenitrificans]